MKTQILLLSVIILATAASAQTFRQYPPSLPIDGRTGRAMKFADLDGDGDEDVLVTGTNGAGPGASAKLYINDGSLERFKEIPNPFPPAFYQSADIADVDGDQDMDIFIIGVDKDNSYLYISNLYLNDGDANFTLSNEPPFAAIYSGAVCFSDIDGDMDQDLLITGSEYLNGSGNTPVAKMFVNDGQGYFAESTNAGLEGITESTAAFADVDGDQDQDVLISGNPLIAGGGYTARLYLNDSAGKFTLKTGTPFTGGVQGSVSFSDVDGDQDQDLLITGQTTLGSGFVRFYLNGGQGNFTEVLPSPFTTFSYSYAAWADVDADGDQDVLILGQSVIGPPSGAKLYINDGAGHFTAAAGTSFPIITFGKAAFSDVEGDTDLDILMIGFDYNSVLVAKLYENDGTGKFKEILAPFYDGVSRSSSEFADVDGDKVVDLTYGGTNNLMAPAFDLYTNNADGTGDFTQKPTAPIAPVSTGDFAWADIDGDKDQDLLLTGGTGGFNRIAKLYTNNGNAALTEVQGTPFTGTVSGEVAFADIDSDLDQDVLITGQDGSANNISQLFTNDGAGHFSQVLSSPFLGVAGSSTAFADVDGDQDQDVLITGYNNSGVNSSKLYINNGSGDFDEQMDAVFDGAYDGDAAFADVDGDQDMDLFLTGMSGAFNVRISKLYLNSGDGHFAEDTSAHFEGLGLSSVAFADLNGDNDQDLILIGENQDKQPVASWYNNDGFGHFEEITKHPFRAVKQGSISTADVDGDQDIDVFITGLTDAQFPSSTLYLNEGGNVAVEEKYEQQKNRVRLYPNPDANGRITLEYTAGKAQKTFVGLYDLNGKILLQKEFTLISGQNRLRLDYPRLPGGIYWVKMEMDGSIQYLKLLVQ